MHVHVRGYGSQKPSREYTEMTEILNHQMLARWELLMDGEECLECD